MLDAISETRLPFECAKTPGFARSRTVIEDRGRNRTVRDLAERLQALLDELVVRHERLRLQREAQEYSTAELATEASETFLWWREQYAKIAGEAEAHGVTLAELIRIRDQ